MSNVTFLYWYGSQELGGEKLDCVVAECSRCGLRVSAQGAGREALDHCAELLNAKCRLEEQNNYEVSVFGALADL